MKTCKSCKHWSFMPNSIMCDLAKKSIGKANLICYKKGWPRIPDWCPKRKHEK